MDLKNLKINTASKITDPNTIEYNGRWSPDGSKIAFFQNKDGVRKLAIRALGQKSLRDVVSSTDQTADFNSSWSIDGRKVAYSFGESNNRQIWVYTLETGKSTQVTFMETDNGDPTWSPDGKRIAFQAQETGRRHLWMVPLEGGTPTQITSGDSEDSHPWWSPTDENEIVFVRNHRNLCLLSLSTGSVRQLTNYSEASIIVDYPSWSFDGRRIYFSVGKTVGDIHLRKLLSIRYLIFVYGIIVRVRETN